MSHIVDEFTEVQTIGRLYEAGLGRSFDDPGLNYWIDTYQTGVPLDDVAESFLLSDEFEFNYGDAYALPPEEFVDVMYDNVLGREPDPAGFNYWVDILDSGFADQEDILISFSDSPENFAQSSYLLELEQVAPGYWDFG